MIEHYDDNAYNLYLRCKKLIDNKINAKEIEFYEDIETDLASFVSYRIFENYNILNDKLFNKLVSEFLMIKKNRMFNSFYESTKINIMDVFKFYKIEFEDSYIEILLELLFSYERTIYCSKYDTFLDLIVICEKRVNVISKIYDCLPKRLSKYLLSIERIIFKKYNFDINKHYNNLKINYDVTCVLENLKKLNYT